MKSELTHELENGPPEDCVRGFDQFDWLMSKIRELSRAHDATQQELAAIVRRVEAMDERLKPIEHDREAVDRMEAALTDEMLVESPALAHDEEGVQKPYGKPAAPPLVDRLAKLVNEVRIDGDFCHADCQAWMQLADKALAEYDRTRTAPAAPLADKKLNREVFREMVAEAAPSTPAAAEAEVPNWHYQKCSQCGVLVTESKSKYCGDGSDKDYPHRWVPIPKPPAAAGWSKLKCQCGHSAENHYVGSSSFKECLVHGCGCKFFEDAHPDAAATPGVMCERTLTAAADRLCRHAEACSNLSTEKARLGNHKQASDGHRRASDFYGAAEMVRSLIGQPLPDGGEGNQP